MHISDWAVRTIKEPKCLVGNFMEMENRYNLEKLYQ